MPPQQLFSAQLELLLRTLSTGSVVSHSAGILVALMLLWDQVQPLLLFGWAGALFTVLLLRGWHMKSCLARRAEWDDPQRVCSQLVLGIICIGAGWAIGYIYVTTVAPPSVQYIFLLIVVLLAALSLGPSVIVRQYYLAYLTSALLPAGLWNLLHYQDDAFSVVVGVMLLLATFVLILMSQRVYSSFEDMFRVNWSHEQLAQRSAALAEDLQHRNEELKKARSRLAELARIDELTGLANRRALNERLDSELRRCSRFGSPLSVIMLDVDYFKNYNDNYGHPAGDAVLQQLSKLLLSCAHRAGDLVARYGGEEFMVLMPGTDVDAARALAVRIQSALAEAAIEHSHSSISSVITVSQGVACAIPEHAENSKDLVARADEALYAAKAEGRDMIKAAEPRQS